MNTLTVTRAGWIGSLVVLVVAGVCVRLGFWQLSRLEQRDERNRLLAERMHLPELVLEREPADTAGLIYRRARVSGRFDHDRSLVLPGRSYRGVPGVHVLTPVLLGSGQMAVLVNRGWQPAADGTTVNLDSLRTPADAQLTGLVLPFPGSGRRGQPAQSADTGFRRIWFSPDPVAIRRQSPYMLLDLQVQALPEAGAPAHPTRLPAPTLDRGPHLGYAIQWFSFAVIALIGWVTLMIRKGEVTSTRSEPSRA
jgi:surfeit locus 1 family protein